PPFPIGVVVAICLSRTRFHSQSEQKKPLQVNPNSKLSYERYFSRAYADQHSGVALACKPGRLRYVERGPRGREAGSSYCFARNLRKPDNARATDKRSTPVPGSFTDCVIANAAV